MIRKNKSITSFPHICVSKLGISYPDWDGTCRNFFNPKSTNTVKLWNMFLIQLVKITILCISQWWCDIIHFEHDQSSFLLISPKKFNTSKDMVPHLHIHNIFPFLVNMRLWLHLSNKCVSKYFWRLIFKGWITKLICIVFFFFPV